MATTDQSVLSILQRRLLENTGDSGATWPSGMWTAQEVISLLSDVQQDFLAKTGVILSYTTVACAAGVERVALPADSVQVRVVAFDDLAGSSASIREISLSSGTVADLQRRTWPTDPLPGRRPIAYAIQEDPTLKMTVAPPAGVGGQLHLLYVALAAVLDGSGVEFGIPDDLVPTVLWGVMARLLGKTGQGASPERAQYAQARYDQGVAVAKLLAEGGV